MRNKIIVGAAILFMTLVFGYFFACTSQYKQEDFEMQYLDGRACEMLQDTLFLNLNTVNLSDYNSAWNTTSNVIGQVSDVIDTLTNYNKVMTCRFDSSYNIVLPSDIDTSYICLVNSENAGEGSYKSVVFFLTDVVKLNVITDDEEILSPNDQTVPLETAAGCLDSTSVSFDPLIDTRVVYIINSEKVLVQFISIVQTSGISFRGAILGE